jgi:sirohydrochlorin ferrochelatase
MPRSRPETIIMKALVLVAHGSRRQASNEEVIALSGVIAREMKDAYPIVEAGFLELAEPSIPDALDRCVSQGATDICVVPYFLSAGRHVHEDIPGEVDKARVKHANIPMNILTHIGGSPQMKDLIRGVVMKSGHVY